MGWFIASGVVAGLLTALAAGGVIWLLQWAACAFLPRRAKRWVATTVIFIGGILALAYCIDFGRIPIWELDELMMLRMWALVGVVQQASYHAWKRIRL